LARPGVLRHDAEVRPAVFPAFAPEPRPRARAGEGTRREPVRPAPAAGEIEALREAARAEGFQAGLGEGRAAAYAEWAGRLRALAGALDEAARALLARRVELAAEVDRQLPRVVLLLTRRILQAELAAADTAARTVMRSLGAELAGLATPVALRVEPRTAEAFEAWRRQEPSDPRLLPGVRLEADPALGPGEWVVETQDGFLDGRIEARLEQAWRLLTELSR
jgi:flagellar assembly protein FliH